MQISISVRQCATCIHWGGPRRVLPGNMLVEYSPTAMGQCCGGGFNMASMPASSSCMKHKSMG